MKKKFYSIFQICFLCIMVFALAGCGGMAPDFKKELDDALENGEITEDEYEDTLEEELGGINLDGVLVLRRPLDYDYEGNSTTSNYYNALAGNILGYLFSTYGILNYETGDAVNIFATLYEHANNETLQMLSEKFASGDKEDFIYFYDAIRYQITEEDPSYQTIIGGAGTIIINGDEFSYSNASGKLVLTGEAGTFEENNSKITINGSDYSFSLTQNNLTLTSTQPNSITVTADLDYGWNWSLSYDNADNSLEYKPWLYAYNGRVVSSGNEITARFDQNDEDYKYDFNTFEKYYNGGSFMAFDAVAFLSAFVNEDYTTALEYAIYSIVLGITPNEITVAYDPVTGAPSVSVEGFAPTEEKSSAALALEDRKALFNELGSYVGLTETNKQNIADFVIEQIIGEQATTGPRANELYYEELVDAIVQFTGTLTTIGRTEGESGSGTEDDTTVGESFIASEAVTYPLTSFMSNIDGDPFLYTGGPYEYQSFVLMPSEENCEFSDIWLDFKYDAGNDGDEIYDPNKYLEIEVSVRWWQVQTDEAGNVLSKTMRVVTKTIRVKDGPIDEGEEGSYIEFELDVPESQGGFGETVKIGKFNCPEPLVPKEDRKVTITGKTDARKYYQVIESSTYGGYGVLNQELFDFSYCEVAFNVAKAPGDNQTNYAFYTAISNIYEPLKYENDPEWH